MSKQKIVITGASGFVGKDFVKMLDLHHYEISVITRKKEKLINLNKHLILKTGHPSPLSANRGYWFGNQHFSKCNSFLISQGFSPIKW